MWAHGFTTERYLRAVTVPALDRGLAVSGRTRSAVVISYPGMVVTGTDEATFETAMQATRKQLAFYASTPAYRAVLELHGWGDLQTELNTLSKRGSWEQMADLIDDDVLNTFAVVGPLDDIPGKVLERFGGLVDRFNFYAPYPMAPERWAEVLAGFK